MGDQEVLPGVFEEKRSSFLFGISSVAATVAFLFFLALSIFLASLTSAQVTGDETIDSVALSGPMDFSALNCTLADPSLSNSIMQQLSNGLEVDLRFRMFLRFESSLLDEEIAGGSGASLTSAYLGALQFSSPLATVSSSGSMASTPNGAPRAGGGNLGAPARELAIPISPGAGGGTGAASIASRRDSEGFLFSLLLSDHQVNPYHSLNARSTSERWAASSWASIPNVPSFVHLQSLLSNIPVELLPLVNTKTLTGWQFEQSDIPFSTAVLSKMTCRFESQTSPGEIVLARISGIWEQTNFFIFQVEIL